jgi:hypothetical protein
MLYIAALIAIAVAILLLQSPRSRALVLEALSTASARALAQLGPISPKRLTTMALRAAQARGQVSRTDLFLANDITLGVAPSDYEAVEPVLETVCRDVVEGLKSLVRDDPGFVLLGEPTVDIKRDPQARPLRPRVAARLTRPTTYRTPKLHRARELPRTERLVAFDVVVDGAVAERVWRSEGTYVIGRGDGADIAIDEPSVSRRHTRLDIRSNGVTVCDVGSTNGTAVNQRMAVRPLTVRDGDRVCLSRTVELVIVHVGRDVPANA